MKDHHMWMLKKKPKFRNKYSYDMSYAAYMVDYNGSSYGAHPVDIVMAKSPAEAWYKALKRFSPGRESVLAPNHCSMYDLYGSPTSVEIPHKICESCGDDLGIRKIGETDKQND